ncbi:MAG: hypothetical protein AAF368_18280, partial [Planctomycetota bacterium]
MIVSLGLSGGDLLAKKNPLVLKTSANEVLSLLLRLFGGFLEPFVRLFPRPTYPFDDSLTPCPRRRGRGLFTRRDVLDLAAAPGLRGRHPQELRRAESRVGVGPEGRVLAGRAEHLRRALRLALAQGESVRLGVADYALSG